MNRTLIKVFATFPLSAALGMVFHTGAFAQNNHQSIFIGPAIILSCKRIELYRPFVFKTEDPVRVDIGKSNFRDTQKWLFKNLYHALNSQRKEDKRRAEFSLALYANVEGDINNNLLLIVPLTAETLGSDFQSKVKKLRSIMTLESK